MKASNIAQLGTRADNNPVVINLNLHASPVVTLTPDPDNRFTASSYEAVAKEDGTVTFTLTMPTYYEITNERADGFTARRADDGSVIITVRDVTEPKTLTLELNQLTENAYTVEAFHNGWLLDADIGGYFGTVGSTISGGTNDHGYTSGVLCEKKVELPYGQIDWYIYGEAGAVLTATVMDPGETREINDYLEIEYDGLVTNSGKKAIRWHVSVRDLNENIHILFDKVTLFEAGYGSTNEGMSMATTNKKPYGGIVYLGTAHELIEEGEYAGWMVKLTNAEPSIHGAGVTTGDTINFVLLVRDGYGLKRAYSETSGVDVTFTEPFDYGQWPGHATADYHSVLVTVKTDRPVTDLTDVIYLMAGPVG